MEKKKQQKRIGKKIDRFMINVSEDLGQRIRKEARERGMTLSNLLGNIVEKHFSSQQG